MFYFQSIRPECKIESDISTTTQKKIDCFSADGFCRYCNTVFEAMGCYYHYCPCQETRAALFEKEVERGCKRREMDQMRRAYISNKGYQVVEMWECEWCKLYNSNSLVKQHLRESLPYKFENRSHAKKYPQYEQRLPRERRQHCYIRTDKEGALFVLLKKNS